MSIDMNNIFINPQSVVLSQYFTKLICLMGDNFDSKPPIIMAPCTLRSYRCIQYKLSGREIEQL